MSIEWQFDLDLIGVGQRTQAVLPEAMGKAMELIRAEAVARTPVESGHLAESATVTVEGDTGTVKYPGPYARYQHEGLDFRHETGQAKFLEVAMNVNKDAALGMIANDIGKAI
jgi:HK97 gp10 family phage protein